MILDELGEFADATSVGTPNNTTVNVGDVIDTGGVVRDIGIGQVMYLVVQVTTAIISGGSATVRFKLASDSTETLTLTGAETVHITSDSIPVATLVAGFQLVMPLPGASPDYERYLGFQIEEDAGQALTGGNVNAFLTLDPASWTSYPDGVN